MNALRRLRIFWWLPVYLLVLYGLTVQLDSLSFAPDNRWQATFNVATPGATRTHGSIRIPDGIRQIPEPLLLIVNVNQNIVVRYPNGDIVGTGGGMATPIARNKHRPLLFRLHPQSLSPGDTLAFELATPRSAARLAHVYIGPAAVLDNAWQFNNLMRQGVVKTVAIVLLITALLIGSIWFFYPHRKEYLWYALGSALWAAHSTNHLVRDIPVSDRLWAALIPLTIGLSILSIITMIYYYTPLGAKGERQHTRPLLYLWAGSLLLAIPLFFLPYASGAQAQYHIVWYGLLVCLFILVLAYVVQLYWERQTTKRLLFVLCGFAMLVFGIHDIWVFDNQELTRPYLLHFAALFTLLSQYFLLVRRFVLSLRETQYYAHHLEELVVEREQELEANYQKMRVLEQEKAVVDERERIMRDIHDGFGGHLVSTLVMLERPDVRLPVIKENIQDALNDLRLVIDSLDFDSQDVTTALGMFRSRNRRKIKQAGFELRWAVEDIATPPGFGAEKTLQLLRIVQEAITNSIKHSGGNTITVSTGTDSGSGNSFVQIADNGCGIAATYQPGKGLSSMRKRAEHIGAHLTIRPNLTTAGTAVRICLPTHAQQPK
ncbi:sensor histidine kinase [Thiothrix subterranea]|uniref:histidine kinase n=1 Tax=Thiothrix subterranea TaxID=2735563 RepID=A0AA51QYZ3_9GAMM|nr:ATP-binding protein [Thiothrix subterranea]MDQ5768837.1 ATP-binding protein [Thiothrix subterranea]WML86482.1 ATP-binding protein [Thiothrix subterranea]